MKNKVILVLFLLIPAFVGLGHDIYIYTQNQTNGFHFISLGWILTEYAPKVHKEILTFLHAMTEEFLKNTLLNVYASVISVSAFVMGLGFAGFWICVALCVWMIKNSSKTKKRMEIDPMNILHKTKTPMKYKRKK